MTSVETKRRVAQIYAALTAGQAGARVLLYHAIGEGSGETPASEFARQTDWLAQHLEIVGLESILAAGAAGQSRKVAITFDDGYSSLATEALAIIGAHGAGATAYINAGWIGRDEPRRSSIEHGHYANQWFLTWTEVRRLISAGWTVGSHGVDHLDLTALQYARVQNELERSRSIIEAETGATCRHFAYTWGRHNAAVRKAVMEAGYHSAAACHHGALRPGFDRLAFARINVDCGWSLDDFAAVMQGDWDYLGWLQRGRLLAANVLGPREARNGA